MSVGVSKRSTKSGRRSSIKGRYAKSFVKECIMSILCCVSAVIEMSLVNIGGHCLRSVLVFT